MFLLFNSEKYARSSIFDIESGKLDCNFTIKDFIICLYALLETNKDCIAKVKEMSEEPSSSKTSKLFIDILSCKMNVIRQTAVTAAAPAAAPVAMEPKRCKIRV